MFVQEEWEFLKGLNQGPFHIYPNLIYLRHSGFLNAMPFAYFFFFGFGVQPSYVQDLLLSLCSGILPGGAYDCLIQVSHMKKRYPIY